MVRQNYNAYSTFVTILFLLHEFAITFTRQELNFSTNMSDLYRFLLKFHTTYNQANSFQMNLKNL